MAAIFTNKMTALERYAKAIRLIERGKGELLRGTGRCEHCAHYVGEHHGFGAFERGRCENCATCRGNLNVTFNPLEVK